MEFKILNQAGILCIAMEFKILDRTKFYASEFLKFHKLKIPPPRRGRARGRFFSSARR